LSVKKLGVITLLLEDGDFCYLKLPASISIYFTGFNFFFLEDHLS
jgi:hypothetical protein